MEFLYLDKSLYFIPGIFFFGVLLLYFFKFQKGFLKSVSPKLRSEVYPLSVFQLLVKIFLLFVGVILVCLVLLRPVIPVKSEKVEAFNMDIIIALDISPSMLAEDLVPNRLERAKREVYSLLMSLPSYRIGLVLFSGQALLQVPLTVDYRSIQSLLENVNSDFISSKGTDLTDALAVSSLALKSSKEGFKKLVILITDGEDHSSGLDSILKELKKQNIIVYSVGVGSEGGAPVPVYNNGRKTSGYKKDKNGKAVISRLDGVILQKISKETKGKVYLVDQNTFQLRQIVNDIENIEKSKSEVESKIAGYTELFQYFLFFAVLLIVVSVIIPNKHRSKLFIWMLLLNVWLPTQAYSSPFNFREWFNNYQGNNYVKKKTTKKALQKYLKNTRINAGNPINHYNLGNTLAVDGENEEAEKEWQEAIQKSDNPFLKSGINFNRSLVNIASNELEEAKQNLIETLKLNPNDNDAKKNLELVQYQMQQQQQQQQQKQQQKKQSKKKNDDKKEDKKQKSKSLKKGELSKEEAERMLDRIKDNKIFNPVKEKKDFDEKKDW